MCEAAWWHDFACLVFLIESCKGRDRRGGGISRSLSKAVEKGAGCCYMWLGKFDAFGSDELS